MKRYIAEFIGTFALVFCGTGAIIVNEVTGGTITHVGIAIVFGLVVMAMIYTLGDISGAHINPAVTFGFWSAGRFPTRELLPFLTAQFAGAILASIILGVLFPHSLCLGATLPVVPGMQAFGIEVILTFFLMFVIINVSTGAKEKGITAAIAVGSVIALTAMFAGPITVASMNPARSFAPALISNNFSSLHVYLFAPLAGAFLGILGCKGIREKDCCDRPDLLSNKVKGGLLMKKVLFICIENSCRSQIAEAFARLYGKDKIEPFSAGSRPSGEINPKAIESMNEIGYDLSRHSSKSLTEIPQEQYEYVITMGCGDICPFVPARCRQDWGIPDPKELPMDEFRKIRALIEGKVKGLIAKV